MRHWNRTSHRAKRDVDRFNRKHASGTVVDYYAAPGTLPVRTRTRGEAFVLAGHTAVVFLEGVSGCVALSALNQAKEALFT